MANEYEFLPEKKWLTQVVDEAGFKIILSGLICSEMIWGWEKIVIG